MQAVATILGILVSIFVIIGGLWAAMWAVDGKIRKIRDWLRDEIKLTVEANTAALRPNGGRSVGDLPDLVHSMRRENQKQHENIGDRLSVLEFKTEQINREHEACPCRDPEAQGKLKHLLTEIRHPFTDSE